MEVEGNSEWWKWVLGGLGVFIGGTILLEQATSPKNPPDVNLSGNISIHLPTLNEEHFVGQTLESLDAQELRQRVKLVLIDSYSDDTTVEVARHYVDEIIYAGRGKLTARNAGLRSDPADIVVSVDAGDFYPQGWLNHILKPFEYPAVVGVTGPTIPQNHLVEQVTNIWYNPFRPVVGQFSGRNSAFRRQVAIEAGLFDENINQFSGHELLAEEEFAFARRLARFGRIDFAWRALCVSSPRRGLFAGGLATRKYREEIERGVRF